MKFDFLIVGAGLSGLTFAQRACSLYGKRCLVIDSRDHIGGNCYDENDGYGGLIHTYGPHYFRTNSDRVLDYLSQFTQWIDAKYRVMSKVGDKHYSFPINLNTFEQLRNTRCTSSEMQSWLEANREEYILPSNSEEVVVSQVGRELYEMFFRGYTLKQWDRDPSELSPEVCGRIPFRTTRDDRYFSDKYQCLPKEGYTVMMQRMIESCGDLLEVVTGASLGDLSGVEYNQLVFTGQIDSFFDYRFGALPYRSLRFEREYFSDGEFYQPTVQVNYPGLDAPFTRIVETKHITGRTQRGSTIVKEYSQKWEVGREPFYPVPTSGSKELYSKYKKLADEEYESKGTLFIGRLGKYRYLNMDQVVAAALTQVTKELS